MTNRYTIPLVVALLAFASLTRSQTPSITDSVQARDERFEHIKLQLRTIVDVTQKIDKTEFGPTDDVMVQVLANNSGSTQVPLACWKSLIHYFPTLSRAGEIVPYSKAMQERLAAFEERQRRAADRDGAITVKLPPNQISEAGLISLSYYYDKLQPGIYELKVKFRDRSGLMIESDTVMFEVTAEARK